MPIFNCRFTAIKTTAKIIRRFKVKAPDQYAALDIMVKEIGPEYGEMIHPCFKFGRTYGLKMSKQLRATLKGAGPEEEE